eukprot:CAMPEP_0196578344 /NCGR_PEP_ID=MMETSP1081-20130531/7254_1 /TAXON_ID=36882 /ORGANISM="Pyramimonas amylifera, Strain CCMP720" /LENGTH=255 /DNA_ID=CAMNT_0041897535 /DNA_START=307 /DNA_END=1074 /DNA_ORIENTATION=-
MIKHAPGHVILFKDRSSDEFNTRLVSGQEVIDSGAKDKTFTRLVSNKPIILERFAEWGFDCFWMDADVFVLQDPFSKLDPSCHFSIQHERKASVTGVNSGVFSWRASHKEQVLSLFRRWAASLRQHNNDKYFFDQDALNLVIKKQVDRNKAVSKTPRFPQRATFKDLGVPFTMCTLDFRTYRCGNHLPCTNEMKREIGGIRPCTLPADWTEQKAAMVLAHQNYMSYDEDKIARAKFLGFWFEGELPLDKGSESSG